MKKVIYILIGICMIISGCNYTAEETKVYPVTKYAVTDGGILASFEVNGEEKSYFFNDLHIFPCKEKNKIEAVYSHKYEEVPEDALSLFLYLNEKEYQLIVDKRFEIL